MPHSYDVEYGEMVYYQFECDECGEMFNADPYAAFDLQVEKSGVQPGTPDGPAVHWFEGTIACPTCLARVHISDSS